MSSIYLKECYLTSIYHYNALEVWDSLTVGTPLSFEAGEDKKAKLVLKKDVKGDNIPENDVVVGELSEDDSHIIVDVLKQKHTDVFAAAISFKSDDNENLEEDKRIKVVVRINKKVC